MPLLEEDEEEAEEEEEAEAPERECEEEDEENRHDEDADVLVESSAAASGGGGELGKAESRLAQSAAGPDVQGAPLPRQGSPVPPRDAGSGGVRGSASAAQRPSGLLVLAEEDEEEDEAESAEEAVEEFVEEEEDGHGDESTEEKNKDELRCSVRIIAPRGEEGEGEGDDAEGSDGQFHRKSNKKATLTKGSRTLSFSGEHDPDEHDQEEDPEDGEDDGFEAKAPVSAPVIPGTDMAEPGWKGWLLGIFDHSDSITFIRSTRCFEPDPEDEGQRRELDPAKHPDEVEAWEVKQTTDIEDEEGEIQWLPDAAISVTAPDDPPEVIYLNHTTGLLGGTYLLEDDVSRGGRARYEREDQEAILFWAEDEYKWLVEHKMPAMGEEEPFWKTTSRQRSFEDVLNPVKITTFESWSETARCWLEDKGLSAHLGRFPPPQLHVTGSQGRTLDGVYNLAPAHYNRKPVYRRDTKAVDGDDQLDAGCVVRWHPATMSWLFDPRGGLLDDADCPLRGVQDVGRPHEVKRWQAQVGFSNGRRWVGQPDLKVTPVTEGPAELFVDVVPGSRMVAARGLYRRQPHKHNWRFLYEKEVGSFALLWSLQYTAWVLQAPSDPQSPVVRACRDVPDPSIVPEAAAPWEVWDPARGEGWELDRTVSVHTIGAPPRRVHISGNYDTHVLYGVYFLRGLKNGRPSYSKETNLTGAVVERTPTIFWGGAKKPAWIIEAAGAGAALFEDIPVPTGAVLAGWIIDVDPTKAASQAARERRRGALAAGGAVDTENIRFQLQMGALRGARGSGTSPPSGGGGRGKSGADKKRASVGRRSHGSSKHPSPERGRSFAVGLSRGSASRESPRGGSVALGPLGLPLGARSVADARRSGGVGPLGLPAGATSFSEVRRMVGHAGHGSLSLAFEDEEDASEDEDGDELAEELELTCVEADVTPATVFLSGYSEFQDAVLFLQDEQAEGRPVYVNEGGDLKLHWVRREQRWLYSGTGVSRFIWEEQLSVPCDTPHPALVRIPWEELRTGDRTVTPESESEASAKGEPEEQLAILEEDEVDFVMEKVPSASAGAAKAAAKLPSAEDGAEEAPKTRRKPLPFVTCTVVKEPPERIFVAGTAVKTDFTGIFFLEESTRHERRPVYVAEKVGTATQCTIRWFRKEQRWVIERVPKLGNRETKFIAQAESLAFVLAGVRYDSPTPADAKATWEVRRNNQWIAEGHIFCRVVRDPPLHVCMLGETKEYDAIAGTYMLASTGDSHRPMYKKADVGLCIRYHMEARRWIVDKDTAPSSGNVGQYFVDCNVPNPIETNSAPWRSVVYGVKEPVSHATLGCYAGQLPPKQVYITGGRGGLPGVYTFMWRQTHNDRFAYRKDGAGWHCWWSVRFKGWLVAQLGRAELGQKPEKRRIAETADAWCLEDVANPTEGTAWRYRGDHRGKVGRADSVKAADPATTGAEVAEAGGGRTVKCVAVGPPPPVVMVRFGQDRKFMAGVYFLRAELHNKRCAFEKQCNMRKVDTWVLGYDRPGAKWLISRHGFEELKDKPFASISCDCPDPPQAYGSWILRSRASKGVASHSLSVSLVPPVPESIFVHGAFERRAEGFETVIEHLPINGVYRRHPAIHNRRVLYAKVLDPNWLMRFHAASARWIIDGRPKEGPGAANDDAAGTCSVCSDDWHPGVVDSFWSLWDDGPKSKTKSEKGQKPSPERKKHGEKHGKEGSIADLGGSPKAASPKRKGASPVAQPPPPAAVPVRMPRLTASNLDSLFSGGARRDSTKAVKKKVSINSDSDSGSGGGSGGSRSVRARGRGSTVMSIRSAAISRRSFAQSVAPSLSGSSVHSGASSKLSGSLGSAGEKKDGEGSLSPSSPSRAPAYQSWVDRPSVVVVPVGPAPERLHMHPTEPQELQGVYAAVGQHCGRPAYRLVDAHGAFKVALEGEARQVARGPRPRRVSMDNDTEVESTASVTSPALSQRGVSLAQLPAPAG